MINIKEKIIENICYTELVYERINKKLNSSYSKIHIEAMILEIIIETEDCFFLKKGKNFYISNSKYKMKITINSNTFRVITVNEIEK